MRLFVDKMAAAAADRPLLVVHDMEEGHLVYDLLLLDVDGQDTMVCFPQPVARFPLPDWTCSFAVSGGSVLGAKYGLKDTFFHDTVMRDGGRMRRTRIPSPRLFGSYMEAPAMLSVGDDTVVRMDTILFDGEYSFELLQRFPGCSGGGGSWHATPLPKPPVGRLAEDDLVYVSAYFAVGTIVWISVTGKGTFSLDTSNRRGVWCTEGTWALPFEGRAMHVPEYGAGSIIGLAAGSQLLCAYSLNISGKPPTLRRIWRETFPWPWEECIAGDGHSPPSKPAGDASLAYLGKGRFCICRPMSTMDPNLNAPFGGIPMMYDACSFLVVEMKHSPILGGPELIKRGKMTYMWPPQGRQCRYVGFIQPATSPCPPRSRATGMKIWQKSFHDL